MLASKKWKALTIRTFLAPNPLKGSVNVFVAFVSCNPIKTKEERSLWTKGPGILPPATVIFNMVIVDTP